MKNIRLIFALLAVIVVLAIVAAASLASWVTARKQSAGLATNGNDPLSEDAPASAGSLARDCGDFVCGGAFQISCSFRRL